MEKAKIGIVLTPKLAAGGAVYDRAVKEVLEANYNINPIYLKIYKGCPSQKLNWIFNRKSISLDFDALILNTNAAYGMNYRYYKERPKILIWHHYDPWAMASNRFVSGKLMEVLHERILRHAEEFDSLVVVGQFWQSFFAKYNFKRIEVIYNPFDLDLFRKLNASLNREMVRRHIGVPQKKLMVYIGQIKKMKGANRIAMVLKERDDLFLIGSGRKDTDLPIRHFSGDYNEYLKMLGVCDVALSMSCMYEGWNRTAHEAMLMGTPVVGNAIGNSGELLNGAGQLICNNYKQLSQEIDKMIEKREYYRKNALSYVYHSKFSKEFFAHRWQSLLYDVLKDHENV